MTPDDLRIKWIEVDALRIVQTALARDLVALRHGAADLAAMTEAAQHEAALALISRKLHEANVAYYEARHALEHQPRHEHTHTH